MKYDVMIIGAGPSGIFTAIEMIKRGSQKKIIIVEKGKPVENRRCPKHKTGKCMNCQPFCPVSYTHLDVYKRQASICTATFS